MKGTIHRILQIIVYMLFLGLTFFYFHNQVDPGVIHFKQQPMFLFTFGFLTDYLLVPGGIASYLSLFMTQFFYLKIVGSALLAIIILLVVFLTNRVLNQIFAGSIAFYLGFIPGFLLIFLHSQYSYDFQLDIGIIIALTLALLYLRIAGKSELFRWLYLLPASCFLIFFFGGAALLVFTAFIITESLARSRNWSSILLSVSQLLVFLILVIWISHASVRLAGWHEVMGLSLTEVTPPVKKAIRALWIILLLLLVIQVFIKIDFLKNGFIRRFVSTLKPLWINLILVFMFLVTVGLTLLTFRLSYNNSARENIRIHLLADKGEWKSVLKLAEKLPYTDRKVLFQANRAMYHLGHLMDDAFHINQYWGEHGLILTTYYNHEVLMLCSDLYFDMGHIKESLHWAYEAQTKSRYSPCVLKRIITGNLIIGNYKAAGIYLNLLSKSVVHRSWARHYLKMLENEALLDQDPLIHEKRQLLPKTDFFVNTQKPQNDLYRILADNPGNKMAFEYLIIYSMLQQDLSAVGINMKFLETLHYERIPVHLEEALLLFMALNQTYQIDLGNYRISEDTKQKFLDFSKILMKYGRNRRAARAELAELYGNTYWFYINYLSPAATNRKIKEKK